VIERRPELFEDRRACGSDDDDCASDADALFADAPRRRRALEGRLEATDPAGKIVGA
jgi:hypothetical protein